MNNTRRYFYLMCIYLAAVGVVCVLLYSTLKTSFMANWAFNLLILCVLFVGIGINMYQVLRLEPEIRWMQMFRTGQIGVSIAEESPVLLKPLTKHLSGIHRDRFRLSALSLRTVLEGIRAHLDESRELSSYMTGLLIFLGLLGTFWGLLGTITAVVKVIEGLEVGSSNYSIIFETIKAGLQEPLKGMGTAFSTSLFGLGGALVLGFLDIQAGQAQNRFFNEMEEWLSGVTQLIDREEKLDLDRITQSKGMENIEDRLEMLVKEIRENQRAIKGFIDDRGRDNSKNQDR